MVGMRDFFDAFKPALRQGTTEPGTWRSLEQFGRFGGAGEAGGELELPAGEVVISAEEHPAVEDLALELFGPDGEALALERFGPENRDGDRGAHNLYRVARAEVAMAGLHRLRASGPRPDEQLTIVAGREFGVGDALGDVAPGGTLLRRLRGSDA